MSAASKNTKEFQGVMGEYLRGSTGISSESLRDGPRIKMSKNQSQKNLSISTGLSSSAISRGARHGFGQRFKINEAKKEKIDELYEQFDEAGTLEHILMLSYLYSAYSIKTRWEEVAYYFNGRTWVKNPMADVDFENLREWQANIVNVAKEEMIHLNYVSVLARAVGRAPNFQVAPQYPIVIPNWQPEDGYSVAIEYNSLSASSILDFVRFESTANLSAILGNKDSKEYKSTLELLEKTEKLDLKCKAYYALGEVDEKLPEVQNFLKYYRGEFIGRKKEKKEFSNMVHQAAVDKNTQLQDLTMTFGNFSMSFNNLSQSFSGIDLNALDAEEKNTNTYKSIAEFYTRLEELTTKGIEEKIITHPDPTQSETEILKNLKLFLLPTARTENLNNTHDSGTTIKFETFSSIIQIISEQGEGSSKVFSKLRKMLSRKWTKKQIHTLLQVEKASDDEVNELANDPAVKKAIITWNSHFVLFSRIFARLVRRETLGENIGVPFSCEREKAEGLPKLITDNIILNLNLLYLVMRVWLHRMYLVFENPNEAATNAIAIASVVAWGLMSQTIRPMLEILSFVPITENDKKTLFKIPSDPNDKSLPANHVRLNCPPELLANVKALSVVLENRDIAAETYEIESIDSNAFKVLEYISNWSKDCYELIENYPDENITWKGVAPIFEPAAFVKGMLFRRFEGLYVCTKELISQIPFRMARGFSGDPCSEDLDEPKTYDYNENLQFEKYKLNEDRDVRNEEGKLPKVALGVPRGIIYKQGQKVLQLKFSGWILNQLATDSDCNMSEVS